MRLPNQSTGQKRIVTGKPWTQRSVTVKASQFTFYPLNSSIWCKVACWQNCPLPLPICDLYCDAACSFAAPTFPN